MEELRAVVGRVPDCTEQTGGVSARRGAVLTLDSGVLKGRSAADRRMDALMVRCHRIASSW